MKLSSNDLLNLNIIDEIISEPIGGAHRNKDLILNNVKNSIQKNLLELNSMSRDEIFNHRKNKFLSIGRNKGFKGKSDSYDNLAMKEDFLQKSTFFIKKYKFNILIFFVILALICFFYFL